MEEDPADNFCQRRIKSDEYKSSQVLVLQLRNWNHHALQYYGCSTDITAGNAVVLNYGGPKGCLFIHTSVTKTHTISVHYATTKVCHLSYSLLLIHSPNT